jgi:outer membrane protein TolC
LAEKYARESSPKVLTAVASEAAAAQAFQTLKASLRPTLALSLSATSSKNSDALSASLNFSAPLYTTNSSAASARRTAALHSQSKIDLREALSVAAVEARSAFRDWEANSTTLEAVKSEMEASRLVAKGVSNEARYGLKTTLDLLDAEKSVNDAELRLVGAEHDKLLAGFTLSAAIGSLTAEKLGFEDVLGELSDLPRPEAKGCCLSVGSLNK